MAVIGIMLIITYIEGFSIKKIWVLFFYYYIMIYIKIKINLVNNEIVKVDLEKCLNWQKFSAQQFLQNKK